MSLSRHKEAKRCVATSSSFPPPPWSYDKPDRERLPKFTGCQRGLRIIIRPLLTWVRLKSDASAQFLIRYCRTSLRSIHGSYQKFVDITVALAIGRRERDLFSRAAQGHSVMVS